MRRGTPQGSSKPAPLPDALRLGAVELKRAMDGGDLSSTELVELLLERIDAVNPRVNAIREVLAEEAIASAREADRLRKAGEAVGALHGIPVTIKDNIDVRGTATTQGVAALADAQATDDAPLVTNLRSAGAIPIARTNMPDFALRWHTDSGVAGATRNPWNPELTPGGSSAGEAVSLATGMSVLGVGNDLGGSLRWPSQCAGTAALRPTFGRIPHATCLEPRNEPVSIQLMQVHGPMARRVDDLRLAFAALASASPRDPWHVPVDPGYAPPGPKRAYILRDLPGLPLDDDVAAGLSRAAEVLAASGYELTDEAPPLILEASDAWSKLLISDVRRIVPVLDQVASPDAMRFMESVFELVPEIGPDEYAELFTTRQAIAREWAEYQARTPLVVAPISTRLPFRAGADLEGAERVAEIVASLTPTVFVNYLGLPSAAVPVGVVGDLPQAVQIIGPRFGEASCLDAAELVEEGVDPIGPIDPQD